MLRIAVVVCLAVATMAMPYDQDPDRPIATPFDYDLDGEWMAFKSTHNKQYRSDEELLRRLIWEENVRYIEKHNLQADRGVHRYWLGMNKYGDMSNNEFVSVMNGFRGSTNFSNGCGHFTPPLNIKLTDLPDQVDWRTEGYVTPVKDQGQCGSCWSFSTTGSLEGQHFRKTGKLVSLSEKNLMDCDKGNDGCDGGFPSRAFEYIIKNKGIDTEESYPYEPEVGRCEFKRQDVGANEVSCMAIKSESEQDLQSAVATQGPISVGIDASQSSFQFYRSGVYEESDCSTTQLDHAVLVVGYGSENDQPYWLVKNSWSTSWGMDGYIRMARNEGNMCGIATKASFPTV